METLTFQTPEAESLFEEVMGLPEKYRIVLHLFYYEDYSVKEIAAILRLSESNVKVRLSRGGVSSRKNYRRFGSMNNRELYEQAFGAVHAPETISLVKEKRSFRPTRRLAVLCACVVMVLGLGITAYATNSQVLMHVFGWGNNMEMTDGIDENGEAYRKVVVNTETLTEPVQLQDGRLFFIAGDEPVDITDLISEAQSYRYEYTDEGGITHLLLVGLNSADIRNYGYAEYIRNESWDWVGGYSARVNIEADGSTNAKWLESAKQELNIP